MDAESPRPGLPDGWGVVPSGPSLAREREQRITEAGATGKLGPGGRGNCRRRVDVRWHGTDPDSPAAGFRRLLRYVHDIEKEFQGQPPDRILLDSGAWVYLKDRVIMGDRTAPIGSQAMGGIGDFSGFLSRIAAKRYSKILVRDVHDPVFWYEDFLWPKPTGIRQAMLENHRETGHIRAAEGPPAVKNWAEDRHLFGEMTVLEPKANSPPR